MFVLLLDIRLLHTNVYMHTLYISLSICIHLFGLVYTACVQCTYIHTYIATCICLSRSAFHRRLPPRQCIEVYICHVHVVNCLLLYICFVCDAFHVIHISINYSDRAHGLSLSNCMHVHNQ